MSVYLCSFVFLLSFCDSFVSSDIRNVLLLGSGGTIGSVLKRWLIDHGYTVLEVKNRNHIDLRNSNALSVFEPSSVHFVLFLACEVGGAKYIASIIPSSKLLFFLLL